MNESGAVRDRVDGPALHAEVVEAIAETEGTRADTVDWQLAEYVDPEVFDRLQGSAGTWNLTVRVAGHTVQVASDGEVRVDGTVKRTRDR